MTSLVIAMLEAGWLADDLMPARPVEAMHAISHDPTLQAKVRLCDGRALTGVQLQREYADQAVKFVDDRFGSDIDDETADVLTRWQAVLDALDRDPDELADQLDWVAKLRLLEGYRRRDGLDWDHARLGLIDVQYSDIRPRRAGGPPGGARSTATPDHGRRCRRRSGIAAGRHPCLLPRKCIRRFSDRVAAASWDSVIFDLPGTTHWSGCRRWIHSKAPARTSESCSIRWLTRNHWSRC